MRIIIPCCSISLLFSISAFCQISKVVNLRKSYTEFLGFKLKLVPYSKGFKVRSHIATCIYEDMGKIAFQMNRVMKSRFKERLKKHGTLRKGYIKDRYGASKQMRYLDGYPLVPIAYIRTKNAQHLARAVCNTCFARNLHMSRGRSQFRRQK